MPIPGSAQDPGGQPPAPMRGAARGAIPRSSRNPSRSLIWFGITLILVSIVVSVAAFWEYRQRTVERTQADLRRLALSLSQQTFAVFKGVDLAIQSVINEHLTRPAEGDTEHRALRSIVAALPQLQNLFITDVQGISRHSARSYPAPRISLADGPAFRAHRAGSSDLVVTPTFRARIDGKWALLLSRPIREGDGAFAGMVAADIDPIYLSHLYGGIDLGRRSSIALLNRDRVLLSRHPWVEERIGQPAVAPVLDEALSRTMNGSYRSTSGFDGIDRLYGYAAVHEFPFVVLAALDTEVVLDEWRRHVIMVGGWVIAADVIIALLIAGVVVQMRRRERSESRFRDFADAASDWYWETDAELRFTYVSRAGREPADFPVHEALGHSLRNLLVAQPGDQMLRQFEADLAARAHFREFLCQMRTATGRVWHFKLSGMPRFDGSGAFAGYRGVAQDITPVVAERSATARANMRFLYAIENGSDAFAFWDAEDRFVMCNENYRNRSGRSAKLLMPGVTFEQFSWESIRLGDSPTEPGKAAEQHAERLAHHLAATGEPLIHERAGRRLRNRVLRTPDGGRLTVSAVIDDLTKSGQTAA